MLEISENDILNRMRRDNPWWETGTDKILEKDFPKRDYFPAFYHLVSQRDIRRAVVLMGPRQVGKTVMAKQAILELLRERKTPNHIFFSSLDTPIMIGQNLEKVLRLYLENFGDEENGAWVFFDEVQYLKDWEVHLKSLVDSYPNIKFVVTGSAAAVLKRKSQESGAGRFSDFILPPLTFREFKRFKGLDIFSEISKVNDIFLEYLAYGGYPELAQKTESPKNFDQYLKSDVLDKVLLRDLPSLYGISDIQEMNRLFASLVFNTGQEISLESLSQKSDVSKATLKKYIEYFEGAFLIKCLYRIDDNAKHFKRARTFKVYVVNPAMYSALFGAPKADDPKMGSLVETAVIAQAFNASADRVAHYARWKGGEVDLVYLDRITQKPMQAIEVKWSDRISSDVRLAKNISLFAQKNRLPNTSIITTRSVEGHMSHLGEDILILPTALFCDRIAANVLTSLNEKVGLEEIAARVMLDL